MTSFGARVCAVEIRLEPESAQYVVRWSRGIKLPPKLPQTQSAITTCPVFYSTKLLAKIKLITKLNIYQHNNYLKWPKPYFGKLYLKCNSFFYFDWSPIHLHGEGGVFDLYCSQPPGGDERARRFALKDEWDTPACTTQTVARHTGLHFPSSIELITAVTNHTLTWADTFSSWSSCRVLFCC